MRNTDAIKAKFARMHAHQEQIVIAALRRAGGRFAGPVMKFRHLLSEPLGENAIKQALKRLHNQMIIRIDGDVTSANGKVYTIYE